VTTEKLLDEIRYQVDNLQSGQDSAELDRAMEKLRKRSLKAFEDERMVHVQRQVAGSLERIKELLERRASPPEASP
jgi:hypothetical protein